ncbi:MAG TPA: cysteine rich repeat-containing protein [Myxococcaceae bacterium]|nr:cysteine rich repeat-containing protein [Myxococcaceae bacterium]
MLRPSTILLLVLTTVLGAASARARAPSTSEGLGKACAADVARLCPGVKPGGGRIDRCLQDKGDQLSEGCVAHLAQVQEVHEACRADAEKFCNDVPPGHGRLAVCIQAHEAELSQPCRAYLQQARARYKEVHEACRGDAAKLCSNVPPGRGRVAVCLHEHEVDLSEGCRTVLVTKPAAGK